MQRIYLENTDILQENIVLQDKEIVHQLIKVLRIKSGEEVIFFDGNIKKDLIYEVISIDKKEIIFQKKYEQENNSEIDFELCLYNALPNKLEKIEYIIQKGTEIGITQFHFFRSERSQKLVISDNKVLRLKKIITEAAEQSGRSIIPKLLISESLNLDTIIQGKNIFFHTQDSKSKTIKDISKQGQDIINLFVGPEGGWSDREVEKLELSMERVHLGNRILRTETTGIVTAFFLIQS